MTQEKLKKRLIKLHSQNSYNPVRYAEFELRDVNLNTLQVELHNMNIFMYCKHYTSEPIEGLIVNRVEIKLDKVERISFIEKLTGRIKNKFLNKLLTN